MDPTSRRLVTRIAAWTFAVLVVMGIYYAYSRQAADEKELTKVPPQAETAETKKVQTPPTTSANDDAAADVQPDRSADGTVIEDADADAPTTDEATEPSINLDKDDNSSTAENN